MHCQPSGDTQFVGQEGTVIGVILKGNVVTEHECGLKPLWAAFGGLQSKLNGYSRYRVRKVPANLVRVVLDEETWVVFGDTEVTDRLKLLCRYRGDSDVASAWSDRDFAIRAKGEEARAQLETLWKAFQARDIVFSGRSFFLLTGFGILIRSRIPTEMDQKLTEEHLEIRLRQFEWKATGVEKLLRKAGKQWFFLGKPQLIQGELRVWLNPEEQHRHNAGWFTPDELRQWAKDKGPVVKDGDR